MAQIEVPTQSVPFNPQSFVGSDAYKFIADQGSQAIQRSAAAKGSLLTGGTLKDLTAFGQGNASTFYGQQLDHDYRMAALNSGILGGNADRSLSGLLGLYNGGLNAAGGMAGAYGQAGAAGAAGSYGSASAINQGVTEGANTIGELLAKRRAQKGIGAGASVQPTMIDAGGFSRPMAPGYVPSVNT